MLKICWIRTNLEIQEHSILYKLHVYRSIRNKFDPVMKWSRSTLGHHLGKRPGHGIQPLGTSSDDILNILSFQLFCTSSRKIHFASLFYIIFCFILYMYKRPQGKKRQPLGTFVLIQQKSIITLITGSMFQNIALPSDFMYTFHDFIHVHGPWAGTDNQLKPSVWCQQEGLITMVICCKFEKNLFNPWLYTQLFVI